MMFDKDYNALSATVEALAKELLTIGVEHGRTSRKYKAALKRFEAKDALLIAERRRRDFHHVLMMRPVGRK